jgi:hypothetical protein
MPEFEILVRYRVKAETKEAVEKAVLHPDDLQEVGAIGSLQEIVRETEILGKSVRLTISRGS